jgi:hypothetical protein
VCNNDATNQKLNTVTVYLNHHSRLKVASVWGSSEFKTICTSLGAMGLVDVAGLSSESDASAMRAGVELGDVVVAVAVADDGVVVEVVVEVVVAADGEGIPRILHGVVGNVRWVTTYAGCGVVGHMLGLCEMGEEIRRVWSTFINDLRERGVVLAGGKCGG